MVDVAVVQTGGAEPRFASVSFRSIFAGWLIATGIAALLYLGGLALGFSAFDPWHASSSAKGLGIGSAIWLVLTWIVSLGLGGMFASWAAAHDDSTVGTLHGLTVWGLSVTAALLWMVLGVGALMHRDNGPGFGHAPMGDHAAMADGAMQPVPGDGSLAVLHADVQAHLNARDRDATDTIVAALLTGHDDVAANLFAASNGVASSEGARVVASIAADTQAAQLDAKQRADRAAHDAACALWIVFASVFLGMLAAAFGGWLGATHVGRIYHLRRFGTSHAYAP
jgi:hypothetical protein